MVDFYMTNYITLVVTIKKYSYSVIKRVRGELLQVDASPNIQISIEFESS